MKKWICVLGLVPCLMFAQQVTFDCVLDPSGLTCTEGAALCDGGPTVLDPTTCDSAFDPGSTDTQCVITSCNMVDTMAGTCTCFIGGAGFGTTAQADVLVYSSIDLNALDLAYSGMLGTVEGTYADSEEIFIVDGETDYTNEVDVTPSWCQ
jgi:hypothetical protein